MVGAIVLGALAGIGGFIPLAWSLRLARRVTDTSNLSHAGSLLLGVLISVIVIFVAAILCIVFARDLVLPFVIAEVLALSVAAIAFGLSSIVRK